MATKIIGVHSFDYALASYLYNNTVLTLSTSVPWHFLNLLFSDVSRSAAD